MSMTKLSTLTSMNDSYRYLLSIPMFALLASIMPATIEALPAGRTWATIDTLPPIDGQPVGRVRIQSDSLGQPWMIVGTWRDSSLTEGSGWRTLQWQDDHFTPGASIEAGGELLAPEPVVATDRRSQDVLWLSQVLDRDGRGRVLLSHVVGNRATAPDTVMSALAQTSELAGARRGARFWVARSEQRFPVDTSYAIRVRFIDRGTRNARWSRLPEIGVNEFTCSIAPLSSRGALLVYAGESGLAWAEAQDAKWTRRGTIDPRPWTAMHPRLMTDDSGLWLVWTDREDVHVSVFRDGAWHLSDSLRAHHPDRGTYWSTWCDVTRADDGPPVLAWGDRGYGYTHRDILCIALPDSIGWSLGEEVPGSEGAFIPSVARDWNGDVWVAWSHLDRSGVYIARTRVSATAESIQVQRRGSRDVVRWRLSASAPGSWWEVLGTKGTGAAAIAGRVRAGAAVEMSWEGSTRTPAYDSYRIRRASVVRTDAWTSLPVSRP